MNVCIFLKEIEVEFTAFINDNNNLDGKKRFIVNNLLASYLHTHFEHTFRHITFRQYGWVASDNLVIDFLYSQAHPVWRKGSLVYDVAKINENESGAVINPLFGIDRARAVIDPFNIHHFLDYALQEYEFNTSQAYEACIETDCSMKRDTYMVQDLTQLVL